MVAAQLLYPGAVMSLPGGADRNVREFLTLHRDVLDLIPPQDIPLERIERLIVVETQHAKRLGRFAALVGKPGVHTILFDHHESHETTIPADEIYLEPYGANTTLLLTQVRQRDISIDPLRATVLALGIYEDTGSLTFSATTPEDAEAVAWLLRQGANLDIVARFINRALTEGQRAIFNQLLAGAEIHRIHGLQILIATADATGSANELSLLVHKLREVENSDAIFALFTLDEALLLVARSAVEAVNAGAVARHFGGGGHDRAASASIHHRIRDAVKTELLDVLARTVQPRVTAATLMSYPVRTISPDITLDDAERLMLRYGHGGLTVTDAGRVLGIVSRRDVDRARHHGFGHAPVRGYLGRTVVTITPEAPLPEIERVMIEHNVGRLPVLDDGRLVGIVTRSDVLRALHGERATTPHTLYRGSGTPRNLWKVFLQRVPLEHRALLLRIGAIAAELGLTVFLVGGAVRDLLLGLPTIDLDVLVEGEGITLAEEVGRQLGGHVVSHPKFHTGKVELSAGLTVDFATARTEFYSYPAALPTAEHSSVREDLYRRDFTMNALAMQLNGDDPGRLLDPFGGSRDLAEGAIRVLHNLSFVEDPTRMLRGVRFEARFGFHLDERTEDLARHAITLEVLDRVSGPRIREELLQLFARPFPEIGLRRLDELGILPVLEPTWRLPGPAPEYARLEDALAWAAGEPAVAAHLIDPAYQRLLLAFANLSAAGASRLCARLHLPRRISEQAVRAPEVAALAPVVAQSAELAYSQLDALLYPLSIPLTLVVLALSDEERVWGRVREFLAHTRHLPLLITGADLHELNIPRGPVYARIMRALRIARLDGQIVTHAEALDFARRLAAAEGG